MNVELRRFIVKKHIQIQKQFCEIWSSVMASKDETKKKRPRRTINLCRICLTHSSSMRELSESIENFCEVLTIREIVEKVMCCEIVTTKKSPNQICSVCLSLLRMSYELKKQFQQSQKKIFGNLNDIGKNSLEAKLKSLYEVELIIGNNNYNLNDVVIVDNDENDTEVETPNYWHYLDKLGETVTVEYVGKPANVENNTKINIDTDDIISDGDVNNIEILSDDISNIPFETEGYETIIIQYVSDTEEKLSARDECLQSSYTVRKELKKCSSFSQKIDSLIIEDVGDGDVQHDGENKLFKNSKSRISNSCTMENYKRKRKKRGTAMKDIEKYIIFGTDGEEKHDLKDKSIHTDMIDKIIYRNDLSQTVSLNSEKIENDERNTENKLFCKQCSLSFSTRWTYKRHLLCEHGVRVGRAPQRPKREKLPRDIIIKRRILQLRERFKKNPMLCQICGYVSKSSGGAKYHSLTHGEKRYKCDLCPKAFYTPSHLKNHFQNKHERKITPHLCFICGENRNSSTALAYHMKLHQNDAKKYPCPICNITFLMKGGLNNHIRRHLGDRRFPCSICSKSFFSGNERKKHMMIHTGERPHKCKYCNRGFVTPFNKKIHMMTHIGPYCCKICFKGLIDEDMLKLHMKHKHCASSSDTMELSEYAEEVGSDQEEVVSIEIFLYGLNSCSLYESST